MNGKGIVNGLRLAEMEASEMLDVLHYFFEEDHFYVNEEQAQYRPKFRQQIYSTMYGIDYTYNTQGTSNDSAMDSLESPEDLEEPEEAVNPFNPRAKKETKVFLEPTLPLENAQKPFGDILDMPLG